MVEAYNSQLILGNEEILKTADLVIGIPAYGRPKTLKEAIDSILQQNTTNMSIAILVSEDDSIYHPEIEKLIELYSDERIVYYYNNPALGLHRNWNNCIFLAGSKYVALLHDDDILLPNYLSSIRQILDSAIAFDAIYFTPVFSVDGVRNTKKQNSIKLRLMKDVLYPYSEGDYYWATARATTMPTCGCIFYTKTIKDFGGFREVDGLTADEIFAERFSINHKVYIIHHAVAEYRVVRGSNTSHQKENKKRIVIEEVNYRRNMKKYALLNIFLSRGLEYAFAYPWVDSFFPDKNFVVLDIASAKLFFFLQKVFSITKKLYVWFFSKKIHFYN